MLVQSRRDEGAATRLPRRRRKDLEDVLRVVITDKLSSHRATMRDAPRRRAPSAQGAERPDRAFPSGGAGARAATALQGSKPCPAVPHRPRPARQPLLPESPPPDRRCLSRDQNRTFRHLAHHHWQPIFAWQAPPLSFSTPVFPDNPASPTLPHRTAATTEDFNCCTPAPTAIRVPTLAPQPVQCARDNRVHSTLSRWHRRGKGSNGTEPPTVCHG